MGYKKPRVKQKVRHWVILMVRMTDFGRDLLMEKLMVKLKGYKKHSGIARVRCLVRNLEIQRDFERANTKNLER